MVLRYIFVTPNSGRHVERTAKPLISSRTSTGDLLSQPRTAGGVGLGTVTTSGLFLSAILAFVVYLT
jgi:uncharacterized membrane-anchored protein